MPCPPMLCGIVIPFIGRLQLPGNGEKRTPVLPEADGRLAGVEAMMLGWNEHSTVGAACASQEVHGEKPV